METIKDFEDAFLAEAVEEGRPVRLFHTTGYQQQVTILDYSMDALLVQKENGKKCVVYRHGISTIVME